ncbi:MAG TPA: hypothetical protein DDW50_13300, partial [Firmicutes bacterium]|nr:hypothetical protein [Bacillota bacterium]
MNISESFHKIADAHPQRLPGSAGAKAVSGFIQQETATWEYQSASKKTSVFNFSVSLYVYVLLSLAAIAFSFTHPGGGLVIAVFLFLIFSAELVHPIFAKLRPGSAESLLLTIPARSKETQKLVIMSNMTTDYFNAMPSQMSNRTYLGLIYGAGFLILLLIAGNLRFKLP